jgi:hypothetical protein
MAFPPAQEPLDGLWSVRQAVDEHSGPPQSEARIRNPVVSYDHHRG